MDLNIKEQELKNLISKYSSGIIAFSGGVDSTFLAGISKDILNDQSYLATISFPAFSGDELEDSIKIAKALNMKHEIIKINESEIPHFEENSPERCYHCKKYFFTKIMEFSKKVNAEVVFDGSNVDDLKDYRPGQKALKELNIVSPLQEVGLTKSDIRKLSEKYNLNTGTKPSYACLASRIPYGEAITKYKLERIEEAEKNIRVLDFSQFRVRSHGSLARLEFNSEEIDRAWNLRKELDKICINAGFKYVCIDCEGYYTGSLNRELDKDF